MKYKIEIGFGAGTNKHGFPISDRFREEAILAIKHEAAKLFGGYTLVETEGGWTDPSGKLVEERGYTLFFVVEYADCGDGPDRTAIPPVIRSRDSRINLMMSSVRHELQQATVVLSINPHNWQFV